MKTGATAPVFIVYLLRQVNKLPFDFSRWAIKASIASTAGEFGYTTRSINWSKRIIQMEINTITRMMPSATGSHRRNPSWMSWLWTRIWQRQPS